VAEEAVVLVRVQNLEEDSGYFRAGAISLEPGQRCVVEHGGLRLGVVMGILETGEAISEQLERVIRKAMPVDLDVFARNLADADEVLSATREAVSRNGLPMHLVAAEYTLDRSYLRICFTAPHRVDFRGLLRELAARYGVRIELRQMGARDEARLKGGVGRCGRVVCCHSFLGEPKPVPMELAYDQELFVSPERITGICGRLMCCLAYEHEAYKREIGRMPKLGMWVAVGEKRGKVIAHSIFRESVTILTDEQERIEVNAASVEVLPAAKRVKR
jgi:cell fate regulator YaaT (PSP1 superfamily)